MKYQCKDCGTIFDKKIDYCDCGNNTFEIIDEPPLKPLKQHKINLSKGEIISRIFFAFCLISSFIILFLVPVKKISPVEKTQPATPTATKEIPDIEKIWKETEKQPQPIYEETPEPVVIIQKIIRRIEEPQVVKSPPIKQQPVAKPVSKPVPQPVTQPKPKSQPVEQNKPVVSQPAESEKSKVIQTSQAVIRYKNALREMLLSKLAVTAINGEGTCIIKFRVDQNGKLTERGFVQYANNKSMNDAIYYMLMSVPKFQPPPVEYAGEIIQLKFYVNNGEYEISFI